MKNEVQNSTVVIGLTNPKSPSNVGAVMRAAGCYGVNQVVYTGQRYQQAAKFSTDTKNMTKRIPLTPVESLMATKDKNVEVICVELVEGATPLPLFKHPEHALYILGPEDGSISQEVVDAADHVVYVPTIGCMNLAATVNVVLYDRLAKSEHLDVSNELIQQSRDTNNKIKINKND
ncbi:RNA methyltransferase [Colwellia sp. 1_MG-2023]|uniref:RNA methyltransferase n=1 Tax=Colwellia sp. 1_MG-2023 TaxID=3062649 RepID=UPI0026E3D250|nr:RNA methyltransferase [Colwellia sp. 1_MG-2023]MDO6445818.1 RNA methyltransferase [Colwellia sp. 1_MG-2023]